MTEKTDHTPSDATTWGQWVGGIVVANVVLVGLEYMVWQALAPLERGEPEGGAVWAPIAIIYELFGYGEAISVIPVLWLMLMGVIGWQTWARIQRQRTPSAR